MLSTKTGLIYGLRGGSEREGELNACDNAIAEKERDGRVRKDDKRKLPSFPTLGPLVKIQTESTRKLSNFNFQWTKTLYQNNLKNIALFFYIFQGLKM